MRSKHPHILRLLWIPLVFYNGAHLAACQSVVWPQLPKISNFGVKYAYHSIHCMVLHITELYLLVLHSYLFHCTISYSIAALTPGVYIIHIYQNDLFHLISKILIIGS